MKTIEKVFEALKSLGLVPSMEEFGIAFKYQMTNYLYMQDEKDEEFFSLYVPHIFDVNEENEYDVLKAINTVNNGLKVVKLVVNGDSVWVGFENELQKDAQVEDITCFAVNTLYQARQRFYEELKKE